MSDGCVPAPQTHLETRSRHRAKTTAQSWLRLRAENLTWKAARCFVLQGVVMRELIKIYFCLVANSFLRAVKHRMIMMWAVRRGWKLSHRTRRQKKALGNRLFGDTIVFDGVQTVRHRLYPIWNNQCTFFHVNSNNLLFRQLVSLWTPSLQPELLRHLCKSVCRVLVVFQMETNAEIKGDRMTQKTHSRHFGDGRDEEKVWRVVSWLADSSKTWPALQPHPSASDLAECQGWCLRATGILFITAFSKSLHHPLAAEKNNCLKLNNLYSYAGANKTCTCYPAVSANHTWALCLSIVRLVPSSCKRADLTSTKSRP